MPDRSASLSLCSEDDIARQRLSRQQKLDFARQLMTAESRDDGRREGEEVIDEDVDQTDNSCEVCTLHGKMVNCVEEYLQSFANSIFLHF